MKKAIEIKKENNEIIKMELTIAGAANLTEMQIVKVNKFNEETNIGYYTVNNDTIETTLDIYVKQEKVVSKAYGAAKARTGIAYTTACKTSFTMKHYKSTKFMEQALEAYGLTLEEVKNAMETLKATTATDNMVDGNEAAEVDVIDDYIVTQDAQLEAQVAEQAEANIAAIHRKVEENPDLEMRAAIKHWSVNHVTKSEANKFETGKTYKATPTDDGNLFFIFSVVKRTEKTITIDIEGYRGKTYRLSIVDGIETFNYEDRFYKQLFQISSAKLEAVNNKPFCVYFNTRDNGQSETKTVNFATVREALNAYEEFKKDTNFDSCQIFDEELRYIFDGNECGENFFIKDRAVDFDTFNAEYHIYTPEIPEEIKPLFDEYEKNKLIAKQETYIAGAINDSILNIRQAAAEAERKITQFLLRTPKKSFDKMERAINEEFYIRHRRIDYRFNQWKN